MTSDLSALDIVLSRLLANGAAIEVTNPDGTRLRRPLARHHRLDATDPANPVVWLRPLTTGHRDTNDVPRFPLGDCPRRGVAWNAVTLTDERIIFELGSGQHLEITPATHADAEQLELWDTYLAIVLTAGDEAALEALDTDSWHGPHT